LRVAFTSTTWTFINMNWSKLREEGVVEFSARIFNELQKKSCHSRRPTISRHERRIKKKDPTCALRLPQQHELLSTWTGQNWGKRELWNFQQGERSSCISNTSVVVHWIKHCKSLNNKWMSLKLRERERDEFLWNQKNFKNVNI